MTKFSENEKDAKAFLNIASEFKLGSLPTECQNQKSIGLSGLAQNDLDKAISILFDIDHDMLDTLVQKLPEIFKLKKEIKKVIDKNGRIFLVGCGATGRLSLTLETLWRQKFCLDQNAVDRVISFMAGGDVALIHSVEKFEDYPEFGERQLTELGFKENDLLIATTEGGETPFVIGATMKAAQISKYAPFFLYCNPDDLLIKTALRSKNVIEDDRIKKINLTVGPMAITGSTRMQATSILLAVVGYALLFCHDSDDVISKEIEALRFFVKNQDFSFLNKMITTEASISQSKEYIYYQTDSSLGITLLTDTTERSPTFSLHAFENQLDEEKNPSLSYLLLMGENEASMAWHSLLKRNPRAFHWEEVTDRTSLYRLYGFDFSSKLIEHRKKYIKEKTHYFKIFYHEEHHSISFSLNEFHQELTFGSLSFLSVHILLKMLMNTHSTLVMGRLGRYESNLMTWVRASNNKLIDRTVRYVMTLLAEKEIFPTYEEVVYQCFQFKDEIKKDQSLVMFLVNRIKESSHL